MVRIGVVIGLDGCGKTSLIELMRHVDPNIEVKKVVESGESRTMPPGETVKRASQHMINWEADRDYDCTLVYDRFPYPDDYVYQSGGGIHTHNLKVWQSYMRSYDVRFVLCLPAIWTPYAKRQLQAGDIQTDSLERLQGQRDRYTLIQVAHANTDDLMVLYKLEPEELWFNEAHARAALSFIRRENGY